jgi:hypothetical protein
MASKKNKRPREEVAVWLPRQSAVEQHHVQKHKQRDKGLEVVFDPQAHK